MAPVKQLDIRKGDWKVDSKIVGEFQHPKMIWLIGRGHDDELYVMRPHFPDSRRDYLTEWDILRVQEPIVTNKDYLLQSKFQRSVVVHRLHCTGK
jgi:hypothetical protein